MDACAISAGQEVLDVAAGTGNVAIEAASEGALVVASDITPRMVELGRERSRAEGVEIEWVEADAEQLPFEDERFDCVVSAFGAMLAPRPEVVARELFRVVRPGGTVGMTAWTPDAFIPRTTELIGRYLPPPEGVPPASDWGDPQIVEQRFGGLAASLQASVETAVWRGETVDDFIAFQERYAGPHIAAREALGPERYAQLVDELRAYLRSVASGEGPVALEGEYLIAVARKRG